MIPDIYLRETVPAHNIPIAICEVAFVELSDEFTKLVFNLLSANLLIVILFIGKNIVAEEHTGIIKSLHFTQKISILLF